MALIEREHSINLMNINKRKQIVNFNEINCLPTCIKKLMDPKGQLISECPFEILDFPKIPPKI